jgi:predicted nucleotidyltransferase
VHVQICGSKAEGLDMKGSDTDIMLLIGNAYENNGENVAEYLSYRYDSLMPDKEVVLHIR